MSAPQTLAENFDIYSHARLESAVLEKIWHQAYGEDYPVDARPNGFYPLSVLDRIIAAGDNHVPGRTMLDVGCGFGKTGLFLAQRMDFELFGIDVSPVSIDLAQRNAVEGGVSARFWVADASSTGLEAGAVTLHVTTPIIGCTWIPEQEISCVLPVIAIIRGSTLSIPSTPHWSRSI